MSDTNYKDVKGKDLTPVVKDPNSTKVRKKSLGKKFSETFLASDVQSVRSYVEKEVIIPAIKRTIVDIVKNGVDMIFFGHADRSDDKKYGKIDYVSYSGYYGKTQSNRREAEPVKKTRYEYDEIIYKYKEDADAVLSDMVDLTIDYGHASVADLLQLSGKTSRSTDNNYGWTRLSGVKVLPTRGGYIIDFPKPVIFDD